MGNNNIFKSVLDGFLYIILYFVTPIAQCVAYAIVNKELFLYSALLLVAALCYDAYSRYDKDEDPRKILKVLTIGIISGSLFGLSLFFLILANNGVNIGNISRLIYLALFVPFFIAVNDLFSQLFRLVPKKEG